MGKFVQVLEINMEDLLLQVASEANGQKFTELKKAAQEAYEQAVRSTAQRAGIVDRINVIISVKLPEVLSKTEFSEDFKKSRIIAIG
ncbi:hypothetical protein J6590_011434 [Homalodisca vitripennis]|nr:hypothetical protein J6590_011434 [Homalodisca vitripennis]